MNRSARIVFCFTIFVSAAGFMPRLSSAQQLKVGIAPVFDGGGDDFGPTVAQHLTLFLYQNLLKNSAVAPVILSPGGVYSPLDTSWLLEYAQDRDTYDVLLMCTLKTAKPSGKDSWAIPVECDALDPKGGAQLFASNSSITVTQKKTLLDYGQAIAAVSGFSAPGALGQGQQALGGFYKDKDKYLGVPSRDFEKQPLGKATSTLADSMRADIEKQLTTTGKLKAPAATVPATATTATPAAAPAAPKACPTEVHITYAYRHSASHSYMLLANGLEQSTHLNNGVATFDALPGELLLQFSVNDNPYKLMKEPLYQMNVSHDCAHPVLTIDLGPSGDAHPKWQ